MHLLSGENYQFIKMMLAINCLKPGKLHTPSVNKLIVHRSNQACYRTCHSQMTCLLFRLVDMTSDSLVSTACFKLANRPFCTVYICDNLRSGQTIKLGRTRHETDLKHLEVWSNLTGHLVAWDRFCGLFFLSPDSYISK